MMAWTETKVLAGRWPRLRGKSPKKKQKKEEDDVGWGETYGDGQVDDKPVSLGNR